MIIGLWIFVPPNYFGLLFNVSPECMKKWSVWYTIFQLPFMLTGIYTLYCKFSGWFLAKHIFYLIFSERELRLHCVISWNLVTCVRSVLTHNHVDSWRNLCTSLLHIVVRVYDVVVKKFTFAISSPDKIFFVNLCLVTIINRWMKIVATFITCTSLAYC